MSSRQIVSSAICRLLKDYASNPLMHLREINLQVHLGNLILAGMAAAQHPLDSEALLVAPGPKPKANWVGEGRGKVLRVQHELKIGKAESGTEANNRKKTDIVLLRDAQATDPVRLTCEKFGPLDVIASIEAKDVEAVIEIKAACSADPAQRHLFRKDIAKLLEIESVFSACPNASYHFVLIDKSIPIEPFTANWGGKPAVDEWELGDPEHVFVQASGSRKKMTSPRWNFLKVRPRPDSPDKHVHVWSLSPKVKPRLRYCTEACRVEGQGVDACAASAPLGP